MKVEKIYLPGKEEFEFREYRYIHIKSNIGKINKGNFVNAIAAANTPLIPKSGGVLNENFIIITPNEKRFYGLSYSKDISGWRQQIEKGAALLDVETAEIKNGEKFVVSNGENYDLKDCKFERYNYYDDMGNIVKSNIPVESSKIL
ncbi:hypothetical protein [Pedobacter alluvionis]|uniref:Uncharacterized protein n=1 Tax=Pedobacter alluvionis TaxID=475253 RepID=A0A497Y9L3_9SPHI|nr:hypothetical protein [Pedobacter alluvionis]RLJ79521.1 hypothetical protein BCL90_0223 [Pedobacter alluvionis]TFB30871.1 hypothetical protein E3V97_09545 [Pedobacter alluvionis]